LYKEYKKVLSGIKGVQFFFLSTLKALGVLKWKSKTEAAYITTRQAVCCHVTGE
jgi:hypothetical protein